MAEPLSAPKSMIPILSAANFVIGMGAFVVVGLLEPLADDLGITPARAGLMMTVYALAYAISSPILVAATGRVGRRKILFLGLGVFAVGMLGCALSTAEGALWLSRIIAAAGAGIFTPVSAAVAAGLSAPERRASALAAVFFGITLAQVAGIPVGAFIAYEIGWRPAFWVVLALSVPCLWLVWTRVPRGLQFQPVALVDLRRVLKQGPLMLAVAFTSVFLGAIYVVYTFMAPVLAAQMGFGSTMISLALLIFGGGAVIGNIVGGALADRIGPERTLMMLCISQIALMPVFSFLPLALPVVLGLIIAWSVCGWSFMAPQQARLISRAPDVAPVVLSLNAAAIYVGAAVGSALGGGVLNLAGQGALGVAGSAVGLLALLTLWVARPRG
ncbi:MFS transporter [Tropicimonas sp. S265A]|uniref:MFS transporter n=1 Tax=Tropicimonas sp. S265A TaxID=3415134 RepID=UPI003C7A39D6